VASAATLKRLTALTAAIATVITSLALAGIGATATPPSGGAAVLTATCPGTFEYPFLHWGDANPYVLAPGGSFEGQTGWTLTGGAKTVSGNESFAVHSKSDSKSLSIPAGGSATSSSICTTLWYPTIRFFATGGSATSSLKVDVIATLPNGTVTTAQVATIAAGSAWAPTSAIYYLANFLSPTTDGSTTVRFRFTPLGGTGWKIDDLYVDPRKGA
jgi:hypothetical protein